MTNKIQSAMDFARQLFADLDQHWQGPEMGMARPGYSRQESEAIALVAAAAATMAMEAYEDLAGNTYLIYPGADRNRPILITGSHLDAVEKGGRYDGPAGVVAAMAAVKHLHDQNIRPPQDICVVIWRNEEGPWFNQFAVGSKLAAGALQADILARQRLNKGDTLEKNMQDIGLDVLALRRAMEDGQKLLPVDKIGRAIEVHIEQGSELAEAGKSLGIVTGIRGNIRYPKMIRFHGNVGHSGTVPQAQRRDAVRAAALFSTLASTKLDQLIAAGKDLVFAWPEISTPDGFASKIPGLCLIRPETRSLDQDVLMRVQTIYEECVRQAALETGTTVDESDLASAVSLKPAPMCKKIQQLFVEAAHSANITVMAMPSGAGHDAGVLAESGIPAGMIFIRHGNEGASHRPDEIMTQHENEDPFALTGDFCNAVCLLSRVAEKEINTETKSAGYFADALQERGARKLQR